MGTLLASLNRMLAGWANYFRHGVSKKTFAAIDHHAWHRIARWLLANTGYPAVNCGDSATRAGDSPKDRWPSAAHPASRSSATDTAELPFPLRGPSNRQPQADHWARHVESPLRRETHGGFGTATRGNGPVATPTPRPGPTAHAHKAKRSSSTR
ncbi:group II intron maturase-specific domain-containing protein [Nonomuraea jabiensis]|uniref:group II intron maturase-specific domain-containing protein n=1 Tax=Nonomuraea jabiensis TaxID=882448 RepID=UPI0036B4D4DC